MKAAKLHANALVHCLASRAVTYTIQLNYEPSIEPQGLPCLLHTQTETTHGIVPWVKRALNHNRVRNIAYSALYMMDVHYNTINMK